MSQCLYFCSNWMLVCWIFEVVCLYCWHGFCFIYYWQTLVGSCKHKYNSQWCTEFKDSRNMPYKRYMPWRRNKGKSMKQFNFSLKSNPITFVWWWNKCFWEIAQTFIQLHCKYLFIIEHWTSIGYKSNERKSEQAHVPHAPTLLENAIYNEWQFKH